MSVIVTYVDCAYCGQPVLAGRRCPCLDQKREPVSEDTQEMTQT